MAPLDLPVAASQQAVSADESGFRNRPVASNAMVLQAATRVVEIFTDGATEACGRAAAQVVLQFHFWE